MDIAERIYTLRRRFRHDEIAAILGVDTSDVAATLRNWDDAPEDPLASLGGGIVPKGNWKSSEVYKKNDLVIYSDGKPWYALEPNGPGDAPTEGDVGVASVRGVVLNGTDRIPQEVSEYQITSASRTSPTTNRKMVYFLVDGAETKTVVIHNNETSHGILAYVFTTVAGAQPGNADAGSYLGQTAVAAGQTVTLPTVGAGTLAMFVEFDDGYVGGTFTIKRTGGTNQPTFKWAKLIP